MGYCPKKCQAHEPGQRAGPEIEVRENEYAETYPCSNRPTKIRAPVGVQGSPDEGAENKEEGKGKAGS